MSFTDLAAVKRVLRIPDTVTKEDAAISAVVDAVNSELLGCFELTQCDPLEYVCFADLGPGDENLSAFRVAPYPVISITEVKVHGVTLEADEYRLKPYSVVRLCEECRCYSLRRSRHGLFLAPGCRDIEITVQAGFATVPAALAYGAAVLAAQRFNTGAGGDLKRERIGRYERERFAPGTLGGPGGDWPSSLSAAFAEYERPLRMITAHPD